MRNHISTKINHKNMQFLLNIHINIVLRTIFEKFCTYRYKRITFFNNMFFLILSIQNYSSINDQTLVEQLSYLNIFNKIIKKIKIKILYYIISNSLVHNIIPKQY